MGKNVKKIRREVRRAESRIERSLEEAAVRFGVCSHCGFALGREEEGCDLCETCSSLGPENVLVF